MNMKAQGIQLAVVVLLLGAAVLIQEHHLWSRIANFTVPWFCSALALALLVVLLVCAVRAQAPADLPWGIVIATVLGAATVLFAGIETDDRAYALGRGIVGTRLEVAGFLGLLLGILLLARRYKRT